MKPADLHWSPKASDAPQSTATHVWTAGDDYFVASDLGHAIRLRKTGETFEFVDIRIGRDGKAVDSRWVMRAPAEPDPAMKPALIEGDTQLASFVRRYMDSGAAADYDEDGD